MGIFQSILDTPITSQFLPPPPVQMYQPHGPATVPQGTPSPGTDAILKGIGIPAGGAAPAAAPAVGAGGAAGAAGSNPGIMALIAQLLPMLGG